MPTLGIPYTFQNGQVADGAHVSANFQAIKDIVDPIVSNATHTGDVTGDTALTIGSGKVVEAMIGAAAVSAAKLATDSVETAKIKDANVTAAKLATDSVETAKIKDGAVTTDKILDGAVTLAKLASTGKTISDIHYATGTATYSSGSLTVVSHSVTISSARYFLMLGQVTLNGVSGLTGALNAHIHDDTSFLKNSSFTWITVDHSNAFSPTLTPIYYGQLASGTHPITLQVSGDIATTPNVSGSLIIVEFAF